MKSINAARKIKMSAGFCLSTRLTEMLNIFFYRCVSMETNCLCASACQGNSDVTPRRDASCVLSPVGEPFQPFSHSKWGSSETVRTTDNRAKHVFVLTWILPQKHWSTSSFIIFKLSFPQNFGELEVPLYLKWIRTHSHSARVVKFVGWILMLVLKRSRIEWQHLYSDQSLTRLSAHCWSRNN